MKKIFGISLEFLLLAAALGFSQTQVTYRCTRLLFDETNAVINSPDYSADVKNVILTSSGTTMSVAIYYNNGTREDIMLNNRRKESPYNSDADYVWDVVRINSTPGTGFVAQTSQTSTSAMVMIYKGRISSVGSNSYAPVGNVVIGMNLRR